MLEVLDGAKQILVAETEGRADLRPGDGPLAHRTSQLVDGAEHLVTEPLLIPFVVSRISHFSLSRLNEPREKSNINAMTAKDWRLLRRAGLEREWVVLADDRTGSWLPWWSGPDAEAYSASGVKIR